MLSIAFAAIMPLGVLAGHLALSGASNSTVTTSPCASELEDPDPTAIECVLQGLAAGTIFFVTFCELLPGELGAEKFPILRALMVVFGFCVMSSLALLE